jgi:(S)-citramalyl-CoA lyase
MTYRMLTHTPGWLFTPGTQPERVAKALDVGADVLIIDLEDAVAPADKDGARATAVECLATPGESGIARALRVNALDTAAGLADLSTLLASPVNLKGLSSTERAQALIALAHPEFRDELTASAKANHLI